MLVSYVQYQVYNIILYYYYGLCIVEDNQSTCQNGDVRLSDGGSTHQGRLEICYNGIWGSVCGHTWTSVEASVVCRQLGFNLTTTSECQDY